MGEALRAEAGKAATALVEPGMRLGIGSGRTVQAFLAALAPRMQGGWRLAAACASVESAQAARRVGIEVLAEEEVGQLDLAIDGADLLTPQLDCLKGLGGALARERLVALGARRFVVIAEESKLRADLRGVRVPVEVLAFAHRDTAKRIAGLGMKPVLRISAQGAPCRTDNGNVIYDCASSPAPLPQDLERALCATAGVVATGYFLGMAHEAILAGPEGVRRIARH